MQKGLRKNKTFRKVLLDYIREVGSSVQSATVLRISPVVDRSEHEIVAVIVLLEKPVGKGYIWEKVVTPTPIAPEGAEGHERHYSN